MWLTVALVVGLLMSACSRPGESTKHVAASASAGRAPSEAGSAQLVAPKAPAGVCFEVCLFIATQPELETAFRGWGKPLPLLSEMVTRKTRNPFTKEELTIRTRIPEQAPRAASDAAAEPRLAGLELVHIDVSSTDVVNLARALLGWDADNGSSEVHGRMYVGPPEAEGALLEVPPALVAGLVALSPTDAEAVAARWSKLFREDVAIIKSAATRQHLLETPDSVWTAVLSDFVALARKAEPSGRALFLYQTP